MLTLRDLKLLDNEISHRYTRLHLAKAEHYPQADHTRYWERMSAHWSSSVPPVRPSREECAAYKSLMRSAPEGCRVLILGSTPELRDLAAELGIEPYVIDMCPAMTIAMLDFTTTADPEKEVWVKANWLKMPFPDDYFDVVLGDVVLHQLTPKFESAFLREVRRVIKPQGFFLTRTFFLNQTYLDSNFEAVMEQVYSSSSSYAEKSTLLRLQSVWLTTDLETRMFNRYRARERFAVYARKKKSKLTDQVLQVLSSDVTSYRSWSPPSSEQLHDLLGVSFSLQDQMTAADYAISQWFPIMRLMPLGKTNAQ